ncbi:hypothetical protein Hanom_Chr14g01254371 [Helianthus anomalus]
MILNTFPLTNGQEINGGASNSSDTAVQHWYGIRRRRSNGKPRPSIVHPHSSGHHGGSYGGCIIMSLAFRVVSAPSKWILLSGLTVGPIFLSHSYSRPN